MADKKAWEDRAMMISLFQRLQGSIDNFKHIAKRTENFKVEVLDNPTRKAELKKLIDEDPDWDMTSIQDKYLEFKAIYDYLKQ